MLPYLKIDCETCNTSTTCRCKNECGEPLISSNNIGYQGPDLICTDIKNCDTLTTVLQKLDLVVCNSNTTTTTTTTLYNTPTLQKILNYQIDFINNTYTLSNSDNNYTIFIENFDINDPLPNLSLLLPLGLENGFKIKVLKTQTGVIYINSDGVINTPLNTFSSIGKINDWVYIEQLFSTDVFYVNGALGLPS